MQEIDPDGETRREPPAAGADAEAMRRLRARALQREVVAVFGQRALVGKDLARAAHPAPGHAGVDPPAQQRPARRHHQSPRAQGGLGLAIVRHLLELHGGSVAATSAGEGQGTQVVARLPLPGRAPRTAAEVGPEAPDLHGLSVLLVEDERDARELLQVALEQYGARGRTAASAAEGLEALETAVDVIVSDTSRPGDNGYAFIGRARAARPAIPAIALTAFARPKDREEALAAGYDLHVAKPVEPRVLAGMVARLAARAARSRAA